MREKSEFNKKQRKKEKAVDNLAKNNLKGKIELSLRTCMIGSLADFEDEFGHLWAHGRPFNELSTEQKAARYRWSKVRESILDRGNHGIKICLGEVNRCEIKNYEERKYSIEFERERNYDRER